MPLQPSDDLHRRLVDPDLLGFRQGRADRLLAAEGAGHLVHDLPVRADGRLATVESRPWRVDPIPVVLDTAVFRWLSLAIAERMQALELVLADLYGERTLVSERIVPAEVLAATSRYRISAVGSAPRRWLTTYAVDLAVGADGTWWVVDDLTDAPPGVGYALLDRSVISRVLPDVMHSAPVASLARFPATLRRGLAATSLIASPRIVLFSGGLDHSSYVDHSYLAVQLGINLVEGADLVVRQRKVWLRTLDGLEPVDVLYRRLEDPFLDPLAVASQGSIGVPGLLQAARASGVSLANANGSGVLESRDLRAFVAAAIERLSPLEQALPMMGLQPVPLAQVPLAPGSVSPELHEAAVVVRMFAVHDGRSVQVLPGGTARVLAPGDHPALPTACTAKDVWVLGHTTAPVVGPRLPQVDFGRSVPTRAADALYWTNRAAERAEAMARTMRVITGRMEQDPGLLGLHDGAWTARMRLVTSAVRRQYDVEPCPNPTADTLSEELSVVGDAVAREIGSLLTEATTVREFLSVTAGRILSHLAELRSALQQRLTVVDDLDAVLADFAALAGLWQESTVRGPAWRIGDTGRRLERCLVVLDLIEGTLGLRDPEHWQQGVQRHADEVEATATEVLLAVNDSLVAYRRRHRSDVEIDLALVLLVQDASNPRSLAACIERLAQHAADGEWSVGGDFIRHARRTLELPVEQMVPAMRTLIREAGDRVVSRWFSTPVNPVVLSPTGRTA
ncbi:MAG TPA: circularly permuted type 2 ATP-grasp protein [Ilumatobacter sp.]|nr:circularly permuted type 2 ATP-grasp protein [Ilumatobacter sp.]